MNKSGISTRLKSLAIDFSVLCSYWIAISIMYSFLNLNFEYIYYNCFIMSFLNSLFFCKDIFGGQSLGKRYYKIQVVSSIDEQDINTIRLITRNLFVLIWPLELLLLIISNNRIGDVFSKTKVILIENNTKKTTKGLIRSIFFLHYCSICNVVNFISIIIYDSVIYYPSLVTPPLWRGFVTRDFCLYILELYLCEAKR